VHKVAANNHPNIASRWCWQQRASWHRADSPRDSPSNSTDRTQQSRKTRQAKSKLISKQLIKQKASKSRRRCKAHNKRNPKQTTTKQSGRDQLKPKRRVKISNRKPTAKVGFTIASANTQQKKPPADTKTTKLGLANKREQQSKVAKVTNTTKHTDQRVREGDAL